MASNLKVDIVKPTATNGSLSLKGDSGGSATSNGISVDSSGNTSITGTTTTSTASLDGAVTINESGADVDFRVESDTVDHALFVQGSDGYVGIGVASPADKLHVDGNIRLTSNGGINFSAYATSGNPSSNLLNDYEEGTWVPVLSGTGGATGQVYSSSTVGWYRKVGDLVIASCFVDLTTAGTISGDAVVAGLPFSSQSNINLRGHMSSAAFDSLGVNINYMACTILNTKTQARIGWTTSESGSISFSSNGSDIWVDGSSFQATFSYLAA